MSIYNSLSTDVKDPLIAFTNLIKNEYKKEYEDHLKYLTVESSIIIPAISVKERNEEVPDYAGMLFLKMFRDCIDFAIKGDCCIAEKCFQSGLTSIFMRVVYAKNIDEKKEYIDYAIFVSNVLLICSEYYENECLVPLIDSTWDKQLDFCFKNELLKSLFTKRKNFFFSNINDTKMGMNSQIVPEFERKIIALIEKVPYEMKDSRKSMIPKQYAIVNHKSALIRHLVKNYREHPSYMREIDIKHPFFVHYFMKNPYLQDCEFDWENEYLKQELEGDDDEEK
jgi:phage pi2 protein 07